MMRPQQLLLLVCLIVCILSSTITAQTRTLEPYLNFQLYDIAVDGLFGCSVANAGDVNNDGIEDIIVGSKGHESHRGRAYIFFGGDDVYSDADLILEGEVAGGAFGTTVTGVGDINGDNIDDVLVGAYAMDGAKGKAYIYLGGKDMDAKADFVLIGESGNDHFGIQFSSAGDINNDGEKDLIVGAPGNWYYRGKAYIYYGGNSFDELADDTITGTSFGDQLGYSTAPAGDVNGDGIDDVIVGARGHNGNTGMAYIFYGRNKSKLSITPDVTFTGNYPGGFFSLDVEAAGDQDNDGFDDILIAAPCVDTCKGAVYLYYGGENMDNIADVTINGTNENSWFGASINANIDHNNDGIKDILIGAPDDNEKTGSVSLFYGGITEYAEADVFLIGKDINDGFGGSITTKNHFTNDGSKDIIISAERKYANAGEIYVYYENNLSYKIADMTKHSQQLSEAHGYYWVGDVNGNGYEDLLITNPGYINNQGIAFLYFGGENMNGLPDLAFQGSNENHAFGKSFNGLGDINGDGFDDFGIVTDAIDNSGANYYIYFGGENMNNRVDIIFEDHYVHTGGDINRGDINNDGFNDIVSSDGQNIIVYFGSENIDKQADIIIPHETAIYSITCIGDFNNDKNDDLLISSRNLNSWSETLELYYGGHTINTIPDIIQTFDTFGEICPAGDVNGDQYDDFIYRNYPDVQIILGGGSAFNDKISIDQSDDIYYSSGIGDINNDGYDDIRVLSSDYGWSILLGGSNMDIYADINLSSTTTLVPGQSIENRKPGLLNGFGDGVLLYQIPIVSLTATRNTNKTILLNWNTNEIPELTKFSLFRDDLETVLESGNIGSGTTYMDDFELIPGYQYSYSLYCIDDKDDTLFVAKDRGKIKCNGEFRGVVSNSKNSGIKDVKITALRVSEVPQGDINPTKYVGITDQYGEYTIEGIYYHEQASFHLIPEKGIHGFAPDSLKTQILKSGILNNIKTDRDFKDTTNLSIDGRVYQVLGKDTCAMQGVTIHVYDEVNQYKSQTNSEGIYSLAVDNPGEYIVKPVFYNQQFLEDSITLSVNDNVENISFEGISKHILSGLFTTACKNDIGHAKLRIFSDPSSCFDTLITSGPDSGYFEILLPAARYNIEVVDFTSAGNNIVDADDVRLFFNPDTVNLLEGPVEYNFIYHKTPSIELNHDFSLGCGQYENVAIVNQDESYLMEVGVHEVYGNYSCPCDTGFIVIEDGLDPEHKPDTVQIKDGYASYEYFPGEPNILPGGDHPYQGSYNITANVLGQHSAYQQWILINGHKIREASYTTVSPEIPLIILRDPPGDKSYSFLKELSSYENTLNIHTKSSGSVSLWQKAKVSGKLFGLKLWGSVENEFEVGGSLSTKGEYAMKITNTQKISTTSEADLNGEDADIYVAAAFNLLYAITDVVQYNDETCSVDVSQDLAMGTDKIKTMTYYTGRQIKIEIEKQEENRKIAIQNSNDSAAAECENQISIWQQTLALNKDLKETAQFKESRSFSAHAENSYSSNISISSSSKVEVDVYIQQSIAVEAGLKYRIFEGSAGAKISLRLDLGVGIENTFETEREVGYLLNDDDVGDYFWIDILDDNVYGTPVFELVSGRSSCPWEPGTQARDGVRITSDVYTQYVGEDEDATFNLNFGNLSQSNEGRSYSYMLLDNSYNALIRMGGSLMTPNTLRDLNIPAGQSKTLQMIVSRTSDRYDYTFQLAMFPKCEYSLWEQNRLPMKISDTITLNLHFNSPCGNISLTSPQTGWVANSKISELPVAFEGYAKDNTQYVALEYSMSGIDHWIESEQKDGSDLGNESDKFLWNLADVQDGTYFIRVKSRCPETETYSNFVKGFIDRTPPNMFGVPQPSDGLLEKGDLIKVTFNEDINLLSLTANKVSLTNITQNQKMHVEVGSSGNDIIIVPDNSGDSFANDTFLAEVMKIEDAYGNAMTDTIRWIFVVKGDDSFETDDDIDNDGITNEEDNCPLTFNQLQLDMDNDGAGDFCDDDVDGDGVLNIADNCPYMVNTGQEDADANGVGDVCESSADGDLDGVKNAEDNCANIKNADQSDMDSDGEGDLCDNDIDGDGVINMLDICPLYANPEQNEADLANNCGDTVQLDIALLEENINGLKIYPIPSHKYIWIEFGKNISDKNMQYKIFSSDGKILLNNKIHFENSQKKYQIDIEKLNAGMYFILVITSKETFTGTFAVE